MNKTKLNEIWTKTLDKIKHDLTETSFQTWIANVKIIKMENDIITMKVSNDFQKDVLESRYSKLLSTALKFYLNKEIIIEFVVDSSDNEIKNGFSYINEPNIKPAEIIKKLSIQKRNEIKDINNRVSKHLKEIASYIEAAANRGEMKTYVILSNEFHHKDVIYNKVLESLKEKGYSAHLSEYNDNVISVSWD